MFFWKVVMLEPSSGAREQDRVGTQKVEEGSFFLHLNKFHLTPPSFSRKKLFYLFKNDLWIIFFEIFPEYIFGINFINSGFTNLEIKKMYFKKNILK